MPLSGCGGTETSSGSDGGSDSQPASENDATGDVVPHRDAGVPDSGPSTDDGASDSPMAESCVVPDGGKFFGCASVTCPAGTVCVQRDSDVTSTGTCATIPPSCHGKPTCACMEAEAQQCAEPGFPPETDATAPFMRCQDATTGDGASYLDFPCGCA
jgi:hypothetical protein